MKNKKLLRWVFVLILVTLLLAGCGGTSKKIETPVIRLLIKQDGKYGYINEKGEVMISPIFDNAASFSDDLAYVELGDKHSYIDTEGHIAFNADLKGAEEDYNFSDDMAMVNFGSFNYGFIDKKGDLVIPAIYFPVLDFSEGLAAVTIETSDGWGFIDKTGKIVIPLQYASVMDFGEGLAPVSEYKTNLRYYIDQTGKTIISLPDNYIDAFPFFQGLAAVEDDNNKWGYIDKSGKLVIGFEYYEAGNFQEGLASVAVTENVSRGYQAGDENSANNHCGYIDESGKLIIPAMFHGCEPFSDGLAVVTILKDGSWAQGYIDKSGKGVIPPQFENASSFEGGLAFVGDGYIKKQGQYVWKNK